MNLSAYIAGRSLQNTHSTFTKWIVRIAIGGVAISMVVMILATSLIAGFKREIKEKVFGFWGHIHVTDINASDIMGAKPLKVSKELMDNIYEIKNISYENLSLRNSKSSLNPFQKKSTYGGVSHIQAVAHTAAIISTGTDIEGLILKGTGTDYNWEFFNKYLKEGKALESDDKNKILISSQTANRLQLKVGDAVLLHFVKETREIKRKLVVQGIFNTGLEEYDTKFALCPLSLIQDLLGWQENEAGGYEIILDDTRDIDIINDYLYEEVLPTDYYSETIIRKYPAIFEWLHLQKANENAILFLLIVVAVLNMITALVVLILENTNLIGLLKALGAKNWTIRKIFLYYSGRIIIFGLLFGNIIGIVLAFIQKYGHIIQLPEKDYYVSVAPIDLNIFTLIMLNLLALAVILFFLIIPTVIVSRIRPVKALQFK